MPACSENIDSPQSNCSSGCEGSPEPCISNTSPGGSGSGKRKRRRRRLLTGVSRQRRAANERERRRVQGVNNAFVELKSKIPVMAPDDVSKMETLHLAAKWIAYLTTVLIGKLRHSYCWCINTIYTFYNKAVGTVSHKLASKNIYSLKHYVHEFRL